jgi:hypothetical protein
MKYGYVNFSKAGQDCFLIALGALLIEFENWERCLFAAFVMLFPVIYNAA